MNVCMHICVYICLCLCICICICIRVCICSIRTCICLCMCKLMSTHTDICTYVRMYVCAYKVICMQVCVCVCACLCSYVYPQVARAESLLKPKYIWWPFSAVFPFRSCKISWTGHESQSPSHSPNFEPREAGVEAQGISISQSAGQAVKLEA